MGVIAQNNVQLVLLRSEVIEQALGINHSAGSGNGNDDFQGVGYVRNMTGRTSLGKPGLETAPVRTNLT